MSAAFTCVFFERMSLASDGVYYFLDGDSIQSQCPFRLPIGRAFSSERLMTEKCGEFEKSLRVRMLIMKKLHFSVNEIIVFSFLIWSHSFRYMVCHV